MRRMTAVLAAVRLASAARASAHAATTRKGPAEDVGSAIDEAGGKAEDELEEAGKKAERELDDGKKRLGREADLGGRLAPRAPPPLRSERLDTAAR